MNSLAVINFFIKALNADRGEPTALKIVNAPLHARPDPESAVKPAPRPARRAVAQPPPKSPASLLDEIDCITVIRDTPLYDFVNDFPYRFEINTPNYCQVGLRVTTSFTNEPYESILDTWWWFYTNVFPVINQISPAGMQCTLVKEDLSTGLHMPWDYIDVCQIGYTYTFQFCVESAGRDKVQLSFEGVAEVFGPVINLDPGVNLVSMTGIADSTLMNYHLYFCDENGNRNYTGDGVSGVFVGQVSFVQVPHVLPFIPTNGYPVTKSADIVFCEDPKILYNLSRTYIMPEIHFTLPSINYAVSLFTVVQDARNYLTVHYSLFKIFVGICKNGEYAQQKYSFHEVPAVDTNYKLVLRGDNQNNFRVIFLNMDQNTVIVDASYQIAIGPAAPLNTESPEPVLPLLPLDVTRLYFGCSELETLQSDVKIKAFEC